MTTGLIIHRWHTQDVLCIRSQTVDCRGQHVVISGKNSSGKTSSIDALWFALGGKLPAEPIRRGADKGFTRLELGPKDGPVEYILERHFTASDTRIVLMNGAGVKVKRPQQLIDSFLGRYSMDPVAFLERRPQDQLDDVLSICGVEPPMAKVEELTRERHDPKPGESAYAYLARLFGDETGLYFVRRREAHRAMKLKEAARDDHRGIVMKLGGPLQAAELESAGGMLKRMAELQQQADARRTAIAAAESAKRQHSEAVTALNTRKAHRDDLVKQIEDLQRKLAELDSRIDTATSEVDDLSYEAKQAEEYLAKLPEPAQQIATLQHNLTKIEEVNAERTKRQHATEQLERLGQEFESAKGDHEHLDKVMDGGRDLRLHLLDGVDLGVEGLAAGDGQLLHNGVPFKQASTAQQLRVAMAVAIKQQPLLHVLRIDNAERLDAESQGLVHELCTAHEWQCISAEVSSNQELRVEIIEGDAAPSNGHAVAAEPLFAK